MHNADIIERDNYIMRLEVEIDNNKLQMDRYKAMCEELKRKQKPLRVYR